MNISFVFVDIVEIMKTTSLHLEINVHHNEKLLLLKQRNPYTVTANSD